MTDAVKPPCGHDPPRARAGGPFTPDQCLTCWYAQDPGPRGRAYRAQWAHGHGGAGRQTCLSLGPATGRTARCPSCKGHVEVKLHACSVHGECSPFRELPDVRACQGCPDKRLWPVVKTRHLLYHLYPVQGNGVWQRSVLHLLKRMDLFNGRRVVAICQGPGLDSAEMVKAAFRGTVNEWFVLPNNWRLREVASFLPLLDKVQTEDPAEATFYAHGKGTTRPVNPWVTIHRWAQIGYETCLDYWPLVERALAAHPLAGSFKKVGHGFAGSDSSWHYSGTFFWFRNSELFRRDWRRVDQQWWGTESYLGLHYSPEEAGCLFMQGVVPTLDLYSMGFLKGKCVPAYEKWRKDHVQDRTRWGAQAAR